MKSANIQIFLVKNKKSRNFAGRMKTVHLTKDTRLTGDFGATIGFFDGVHRGHQYVVKQLREQATRRGLPSMVVTFDRHPRQVVQSDWQPLLLSTLEEKERLLAQTGIDMLVVLSFDEQMAALSAHDFMQQVLKEQLGVSMLLTGYDNHFGHRQQGKAEGFDDYVAYGREVGIDVVCGFGLQLKDFGLQTTDFRLQTSDFRLQTIDDGGYVSSSLVRRLLGEGRVEEVALCLGRPYEISGIVAHGEQMGRQIGFPTANISIDTHRMIPKRGVYAVRLAPSPSSLIPHPSSLTLYQGMTNIGMRPTFDGHKLTIETHIFDFHEDLYGRQLTIQFMARLRDEQSFESAEALALQMQHDEQQARKILTPHP